MPSKKQFLTAKEAAEILNITPATLYAYVSRGLVRSESTGGKRRTKRYYAEDVRRLKERQDQRRNPAQAASTAAAAALHFGRPVLESAITLISNGRLYYRGRDALTLAQQYPLEQIAILLWNETADHPRIWSETAETLFETQPIPASPTFQAVQNQITNLTPMEKFQILLPLAAANDFSAYDFRPEAVQQTGARISQLPIYNTS
jgi:citrate synthase